MKSKILTISILATLIIVIFGINFYQSNQFSIVVYDSEGMIVDGIEYENLNGRTCLKRNGCYREIKDISIEFLDTYAECIKYCYEGDCEEINEDGTWSRIPLSSEGLFCSRYNLDKYIIEVMKR